MAKAPKNGIKVNFAGVETASVVPEGEYIAEIVSGAVEEGEKGEYISWELSIADGKYKGKKLYHNTSLAQQSLWSTKRYLESAGVEVPDGEFVIDFKEIIGLSIGVVIEHDSYKGRTKSRIIDTYPAEGGEEGAEEAETAGGDDLPTDDEIDEMGKSDLKDLVEKHELDVELIGSTKAQRREVKKAIAQKRDSENEKPTKAGAKVNPAKKDKKKVTYAADDVASMSTEELAELVEKHELDVDFDKVTVLRKQRAAVTDALEEAELLTPED